MNISYFTWDQGACDYYRAELPMQTIAKYGSSGICKIPKGCDLRTLETATKADIFLIPRPCSENMLNIIHNLKANGKKVVLDYDDDMFSISPLSPHYKDFGITEVAITAGDGEVVHTWKDKDTFDISKNKAALQCIETACMMADAITVTTPLLAEAYKKYNKNVYAINNCIDLNLWNKLDLKRKDDDVRLYWSGGSSHYEDFSILTDVLPEVLAKYPKAKLVLMGMLFGGPLYKCPADRVEFHQWVHNEAYPYKTAILNNDISLIPLADTDFNSRKSPIKLIEQSALAVPSVVSYVSPYKELERGDNAIYIKDNDHQAWFDGISLLIEDKLLRWKIGGEARTRIETEFNINKQYTQWENIYKEILG